jgi:hypothetical protein
LQVVRKSFKKWIFCALLSLWKIEDVRLGGKEKKLWKVKDLEIHVSRME